MDLKVEKIWLLVFGLVIATTSGIILRVAMPSDSISGFVEALFTFHIFSEYFYVVQVPILLSPLFVIASLLRKKGQNIQKIIAIYIPLFLLGAYIVVKGLGVIGVFTLAGCSYFMVKIVRAKHANS